MMCHVRWTSGSSRTMIAVAAVLVLVAAADAARAAVRQPLLEEFTNVQSPPDWVHHPWFEAFLAAHKGELSTVYYHMYWPGYDPWWEDNPETLEERRIYYGVDEVPNCRIDAVEPNSYPYTLEVLEERFAEAMTLPTGFALGGSGAWYVDQDAGHVVIDVSAESAPAPGLSVRLSVALVETEADYDGYSGYDSHPFPLRAFLSLSLGDPIGSFDGPYPETRQYGYDWAQSDDWLVPAVTENLVVVAWLSDAGDGAVLQSTTLAVADFALLHATSPPDLDALAIRTSAPTPNPFRRRTSLEVWAPDTETLTVGIYTAGGRRVRASSLVRGGERATVTWDGRSDGGHRVPSGVYFIEIATPTGRVHQRVTLID